MIIPNNTHVQNRYLILRLLGQGGFGAVYEARDLRLGHRVALKQLTLAGPQILKAFEREARILARLKHAVLPKVSDYFVYSNSYFLVMEYIEGDDFEALLAQRTVPFSVQQVLEWADQLLDALDYLHRQQPPVIHRDIKPANIKLSPDGKIYLLDFGISKGGQTHTYQAVSGASLYAFSQHYASIEQIEGKGTDARSDVYSLAVTLHYFLSKQKPPQTVSRASAKAMNRPDPLPPLNTLNWQIPVEVGQVLTSALNFDPNQRPQSAHAMRQMLKEAEKKASDSLLTQPIYEPPRKQPTSSTLSLPLLVGLGILLLLVGFVGGRMFLGGTSDLPIAANDTPQATAILDEELPATKIPVTPSKEVELEKEVVVTKIVEVEKEVVVTEIVEIEKEIVVTEIVEVDKEVVVTEVVEVDKVIVAECDIDAPTEATTINMIGWAFPITEFYAEELERCNPVENLEVNTQLLDSSGTREQVRLGLSGGGESPFAIIHGANGDIVEWGSQGWVMPLNEMIEKYGEEYDLDDIPVKAWEGGTYEGHIYGIPIVGNTLHMMYRTDLFEQYNLSPPTTYDEVIAACDVLKDESSIDIPFTMNLHAGWAWEIEFFHFLESFEGTYLNDDNTPAFNSPQGVEAVNKMKEVADACMGAEGLTFSVDDSEIGMETGALAFVNLWASRAANMDDPDKSDFVEGIGFAPAAAPNPGGALGGSAWNDFYMIPATTDVDPEVVFQVIMEATDLQSQEKAAKYGIVTRRAIGEAGIGGRYLPAASETIANGVGIYDANPAIALARSALASSLPLVGTGQLTPEEALEAAAKEYLAEAEAQGFLK